MRILVIAAFCGVLLLPSLCPASESPLADAAEDKDAAAVKALLGADADVNQPQVDGMTALHWAVYHDDLDLAEMLIRAKADVAVGNRYSVTPLSIACANGSTEMVELLLTAGADPETTLRGGETVLMTAARTGQIGPVKKLLASGAAVDAKEWRGQTALMWAAADGHTAVVEALLKAGADFRTPLKSGFTPLFFAVREGHRSVVQVLLEAGLDVNDVMRPEKNVGKGPRNGTSALILAVENGHFELATDLLEAGADPNDQRCGFTALHVLTWVRKPNRGDGADGEPAPIGSGNMDSLQFVDELKKHGTDVNARLKRGRSGRGRLNETGASPFLLAAKKADLALMKKLLEIGADPFLPNVDGATPLMAAAGIGTLAPGEEAGTEPEALAAVKLLLKMGASVNTVDRNGETAMHGAAYKSMPAVAKWLADNGADIEIWNKKNKYGWTPLLIAEGHRPGNFKPSAVTIKALRKIMTAAGVTPPSQATPRAKRKRYEDK